MPELKPPFKHDMFVSYAHGMGTLRDWTQKLEADLCGHIQEFVPDLQDFSVFIDKDFDPEAQLTKGLREKVKSSGLLMLVMSDRYLNSEWCRDELTWFQQRLKDYEDNEELIFIVQCQPTDRSQWPDILKDERGHANLGYMFYDKSDQSPVIMPFGVYDLRAQDYRIAVHKLACGITTKMRLLKEKQEAANLRAASQVKQPKNKQPGVFLDPSGEDPSFWQDIHQKLSRVGCNVFAPSGDEIVRDARDVNKVRQERLRVLKDEADAAVVIGANADAEDSLLNLFEDLKTIEDDMPRAFIDANGTSPRLADALGFQTLKADQSTWFTVILDWLREHYELEFQI